MFEVPALRSRSSALAVRQPKSRAGMTDRQLECLAWVAEGKSASDIGAILGISARTVEEHLMKACGHYGVRTRFQAVLRALDEGLILRPTPDAYGS